MAKGKIKTRTEVVDPKSLIPNPRNDKIHSRRQIDSIKASLTEFGQHKPVIAREANRMLCAGHAVWEAISELQMPVEVKFLDVDQETADKILLADNRMSELGETDKDRRRALLQQIEADDFAAIGFLPEEVEELLAEGTDEIEVREIETTQVEDRFWITLRGPLVEQAWVLQRLQELLGEKPEVEIEQGTIQV